jgi:hypothetical protein
MSIINHYYIMNIGEAAIFMAIGFIPTLVALELVYRMGRAIGKRGEISSVVEHGRLKSLLA